VVAERCGVDAHSVGDFIDGKAVVKRGNGSSLDQVAGIEIEAGGAVFALVPDGPGDVGETTEAAIVGKQVSVEIVGVEDGERDERGLSEEGRAGERDDREESHTRF